MGSIDPQRIIAVTGTRGGVGASTVATAMANAISERHFRRALLVDLDLHGGTQYLAFNTDPTPGLFEILQSPQRVDALFFERTVTRVSSRLALLSADETDAEVEATDEGLDALLSQARQGIDAVVLDIPRRAAVGQRALRSAGTVVIVTALTLPCLRETIKLIENVERKGTVNQILVAVNRVGEHRAGVMTAKDFSKQIRRDVITLPFDPRAVTQALAQAKPLIDFRRPISDSLIKLASHLPTAPQHSASFFDKLWGR